jgi:hypothetical protein
MTADASVFLQGLSGQLKVPKAGKVRKGWTLVSALVRDFQLYVSEKENINVDGKVVADLR